MRAIKAIRYALLINVGEIRGKRTPGKCEGEEIEKLNQKSSSRKAKHARVTR